MDNPNYISLSELLKTVQGVIYKNFSQRNYIIKAEIANLSGDAPGKHMYLELIDNDDLGNKSKIQANLWSTKKDIILSKFRKNGLLLKNGIQTIFNVSVNYHVEFGLRLHINDIDTSYILGDMVLKRRENIKKLTAEKIIDSNKKLKFPVLPKSIAVIASEKSSSIEDFVKTIKYNKYDYDLRYKIYNSLMQGDDAIESIKNQLVNVKKKISYYDVLVIIRGGGNKSDFEIFNDYGLCREICLFPIPVITGIGHTDDENIIDFVASRSMKTPTDAGNHLIESFIKAEQKIIALHYELNSSAKNLLKKRKNDLNEKILIFNSKTSKFISKLKENLEIYHINLLNVRIYISNLKSNIRDLKDSFKDNVRKEIDSYNEVLKNILINLIINTKNLLKDEINNINKDLSNILFSKKTIHYKVRSQLEGIKSFSLQIKSSWISIRDKEKLKIQSKEELVKSYNPLNVLKRGYSITYFLGKAITSVNDMKKGDEIKTILYQGEITSTVNSENK